jgi:hypothetical protein
VAVVHLRGGPVVRFVFAVQEYELQLRANRQGVRSRENELMAEAVAGYGRRVGIYMVMVRRARLGAVAPGVGLAPAR